VKPRHVILTVLATLVIFASGVVTGGLLVRKVNPPLPPPRPGWPMARFDQFQRAVDSLDLRPEQRRKILGIIRERQAYVADMMRLIEPDLPGLFAKLRDDIKQELTTDQRRDLDQLWDRVQQRRLANRGGEFLGRPGDDSGFLPEPPFLPDGRRPPPPRLRGAGPRPLGPERPPPDRLPPDRLPPDRLPPDRMPPGARPPPTNPQPLPPPQP
jgi:hypothetical protein